MNHLRLAGILRLCVGGMLAVSLLASCSDDYTYDDEDPNFLGGSIYEYLQGNGNFTNYLRLVDDLGYGSVLNLTGSKAVFPANDEAFGQFFASNSWGVRSYRDLTYAQKQALLFSSMVDQAYLSNMLANLSSATSQTGEGMALRHVTSYSYLDSVQFVTSAAQLDEPYWTRFKEKGLYLVDNAAAPYMVHFTPQHTSTNNIPTSDLSLVLGQQYNAAKLYVNGIQADTTDITCKNGYVHVMHSVLTPMQNMSQVIAGDPQTSLFNHLMNKFSAPYFEPTVNMAVHNLYTGMDTHHPLIADSVFVKRYFTEANHTDPDGNDITDYGTLWLDPSDNSYSNEQDMGCMFVPTDDALSTYINSGKGQYLKDAYGSWDNIPTSLLALFVKNHQKKSFMNSLPSAWADMNDESSFKMSVSSSDVVKTYIAGNGVVYVTNKVYPPIDYQCVYGPVLTGQDTKIMNAAIQNATNKFSLYLRSMENMYNLLVPTDEALQQYRDPISWAKGKNYREIWAFHYDSSKSKPYSVDIYSVNADGTRGSFKRTSEDQDMILNRLYDICDRHIVVGTMDDDGTMGGYIDAAPGFWQTKGGSTIRTASSGENMTVQGGDADQATLAHLADVNGKKGVYDSDNGRTYVIDRVLQDPTKSVYNVLGNTPEYSSFYELLIGNDMVFKLFEDDSEIRSIFTLNRTSSSSGLGQVVAAFNNFRYTVFVPTNAAVAEAFKRDPDLHTWDEINEQDNTETKRQWTKHLLRFLNYHFMDNSVYVGQQGSSAHYETAARNDAGRFQELTVNAGGGDLSITDAHGNVAHVVKTDGLYNVQARDMIVNNADYQKATQLISSSFSAIHLIDKALLPE